MSEYNVIRSGFDNIELEYESTQWEPVDQEVRNQIGNLVAEKKQSAEESGAEFYNGNLVRMKDSQIKKDDTLYLELEDTKYFDHVGTRDNPDLSKENRADPLSVGVRLTTNDAYMVLGERSSLNDIGEGEFQLPAGFVENPTSQYERSLNAETPSPVHREVEEELNLYFDRDERPVPHDLIGAVTYQPMLVYDAQTAFNSEEVAEQWSRIPDDDKEFSRLVFLDTDNLDEVIVGEKEARYSVVDEQEIVFEETSEELPLRPHAKGALDTYPSEN